MLIVVCIFPLILSLLKNKTPKLYGLLDFLCKIKTGAAKIEENFGETGIEQ